MSKELVRQLRYLGLIQQTGFVEYGFRIENDDKSIRQVILTIENALFRENNLKFQEAPDLCYQKVLTDLETEDGDSRMPERIPVTVPDIEHYRGLHPSLKPRKFAQRDAKPHQNPLKPISLKDLS
jgi:hypothetical protein